MRPWLTEGFGNAHSLHELGRRSRDAVESARQFVVDFLGAEDPLQILFTSGATEGNNAVISAFSDGEIGRYEHSAVREPALIRGFGEVDTPFSKAFGSHMTVNNETGAWYDPSALRGSATFFHTDATQAVGKVPLSVDGLQAATFSSHKFYGPKGVGVLYLQDPFALPPYLRGGDQEDGRRAGTLNVPGIVGLAAALGLAKERQADDFDHARLLRREFMAAIRGFTSVREADRQSPFIVNVSFSGVTGETLVIEMDRLGFAISSGAACSSRSMEPSHVLTALGLPETEVRGAIRVSFGRDNSVAATRDLAHQLSESAEKLRKLRG